MKNKQLLNKLHFQQRRLINTEYESILNIKHYSHDEGIFISFFIYKDKRNIFDEIYKINDHMLNEKIKKLVYFIDGILDKK